MRETMNSLYAFFGLDLCSLIVLSIWALCVCVCACVGSCVCMWVRACVYVSVCM